MKRNRKVLVALVVSTLGVTFLVATAIASPARPKVRVVGTAPADTTATASTATPTIVAAFRAATSTPPASDATTTTTEWCAPPPGALRSFSDLVSTITFDHPTVEIGESVGYTHTVENPHDQPVAVEAAYGVLVFPWQGFDEDASGTGSVSACSTLMTYPPHSRYTATGTFTPPDGQIGTIAVHDWIQDHLVPLEELGGPGGSITVLPAPADTTSTTGPNSPTTLAAS
jgi:hypothetical protein